MRLLLSDFLNAYGVKLPEEGFLLPQLPANRMHFLSFEIKFLGSEIELNALRSDFACQRPGFNEVRQHKDSKCCQEGSQNT